MFVMIIKYFQDWWRHCFSNRMTYIFHTLCDVSVHSIKCIFSENLFSLICDPTKIELYVFMEKRGSWLVRMYINAPGERYINPVICNSVYLAHAFYLPNKTPEETVNRKTSEMSEYLIPGEINQKLPGIRRIVQVLF